jgi:hypothetical protein
MAGKRKPAQQLDVFGTVHAMIHEAAQKHADKANVGTSYSVGGPFRQVVSGNVRVLNNFQTHHYNMATNWNLALEVGNNIKGANALDLTTEIFKSLVDTLEEAGATVQRFDTGAHISHEGNELFLKYEYASSYCWIAARVTAVAPVAEAAPAPDTPADRYPKGFGLLASSTGVQAPCSSYFRLCMSIPKP